MSGGRRSDGRGPVPVLETLKPPDVLGRGVCAVPPVLESDPETMNDVPIPMIEVAGLDVVFGHGARALRAVGGVSFTVDAGTSFGLVGESGSGKTTVLRALGGLLPHVARAGGLVRLAGERLGAVRSRGFRRRVQMVFQDPCGSLHPRHTVDQILGEPARAGAP